MLKDKVNSIIHPSDLPVSTIFETALTDVNIGLLNVRQHFLVDLCCCVIKVVFTQLQGINNAFDIPKVTFLE